MKKYRLTIMQTLLVGVEANTLDEAYEKYHNLDQYESSVCIDESTERIEEI